MRIASGIGVGSPHLAARRPPFAGGYSGGGSGLWWVASVRASRPPVGLPENDADYASLSAQRFPRSSVRQLNPRVFELMGSMMGNF